MRSSAITNPHADDMTILALHEAGKSSRQTQAILGNIDHATICRRLQHLTPRKTTEIYKSLRADILAEKQRKILMRSDKSGAKELRDYMTSFGILYDKERIERGLNDSNITPMVVIQIKGDNTQIAVDHPVDNSVIEAVVHSCDAK